MNLGPDCFSARLGELEGLILGDESGVLFGSGFGGTLP